MKPIGIKLELVSNGAILTHSDGYKEVVQTDKDINIAHKIGEIILEEMNHNGLNHDIYYINTQVKHETYAL